MSTRVFKAVAEKRGAFATRNAILRDAIVLMLAETDYRLMGWTDLLEGVPPWRHRA